MLLDDPLPVIGAVVQWLGHCRYNRRDQPSFDPFQTILLPLTVRYNTYPSFAKVLSAAECAAEVVQAISHKGEVTIPSISSELVIWMTVLATFFSARSQTLTAAGFTSDRQGSRSSIMQK